MYEVEDGAMCVFAGLADGAMCMYIMTCEL